MTNVAAANASPFLGQLLVLEPDETDQLKFARCFQHWPWLGEGHVVASMQAAIAHLRRQPVEMVLLNGCAIPPIEAVLEPSAGTESCPAKKPEDFSDRSHQPSDRPVTPIAQDQPDLLDQAAPSFRELLQLMEAQAVLWLVMVPADAADVALALVQQGAADYVVKDAAGAYLKLLPITLQKSWQTYQQQRQLQWLNHTVQSLPDGVYVADAGGQLLFTNDALKAICAIEQQNLQGQPITTLGQPALTRWVQQQAPIASDLQQPYHRRDVELAIQQPDRPALSMLLSETFIDDGCQAIRVGVLKNVHFLKEVQSSIHNVQSSLNSIIQSRTNQLQEAIGELHRENQERIKSKISLRLSRDFINRQQVFLRSVIDNNPNLIFVKDWEGRYVLANQAMADYYGTTVDELLNKTDEELLGPSEANARFLSENRFVIENRQELFLPEEMVIRRKIAQSDVQPDSIASVEQDDALLDASPESDLGTNTLGTALEINLSGAGGSSGADSCNGQVDDPFGTNPDIQWLQWHKSPIFLPAKGEYGVLGVGVDITARKQVELALAEQEKSLSTLVANLPGYVYRVANNPEYSALFVSDGVTAITGYETHEYLVDRTTSCGQEIHPEDADRVWEIVQAAIQKQEPYECEYRILTKFAQEKWVWERGSGVYSDEGKFLFLEGFVTDISDRKAAEQNLRQLSDRLQESQRIAKLGNWQFNLNSNALYWSDQVFEIFEVDAQQFGASYEALMAAIHPDDREMVDRAYKRHLVNHEPYSVTHRLLLADGRIKYVHEQCETTYGEDGTPLYSQGTVQDVTDQHLAEMAREQAEKALHQVIEGTATVTGAQFFPNLVRHIAEALNVDYVVATELRGDRLQTLGVWVDGQLGDNSNLDLENTPYSYILEHGELYCETGGQSCFSISRSLFPGAVNGLLGVALQDDQGQAIGSLCILDQQPFSEEKHQQAMALLRVLASRAGAELQRKQANDALEQLNQDLEARVLQRTLELQAQEAQLRDLFDNATDLIQRIDPQGQILLVNRVWKETLGYGDEDLNDLSIFQVVHPADLEDYRQYLDRLCAGEASLDIETRFLSKDGQEILLEGNANCDFQEGKPIAIRSMFRNVTEGKQTRKALQESQQFLQTVLNTFPLFVFWKDRNSVYLGCNQNFAAAAGLPSPEAIVGKTDYDLPWGVSEAELYRADDREVIESGMAKLHLIESQKQLDGSLIQIETNKVPLRDSSGTVIGVLGIYQDITDRQAAELQLQRTNQQLLRATRLKDEFMANMSHELRTPLNAILGMTESLQEEIFGPITPQQDYALRTIDQSGTHLLELINDILDMAKIESGQMELDWSITDLVPMCRSSLVFIQQQATKKRIELNLNSPENLPNLWVDERRLRQVLINLLSNAVKFTPEGGKITLSIAVTSESLTAASEFVRSRALSKMHLQGLVQQPPAPTAPANQPTTFVRIAVADTGIGIAAENLPKLFQPFIQVDGALNRQYDGTGLGLALVKQIVELHQGCVDVVSEVGVGSCFTIELPLLAPPPHQIP